MVNATLIGFIISSVVALVLAGLLFSGVLCETCKVPEPLPTWCKSLEDARKNPLVLNGEESQVIHPQKIEIKDSYADRIYKWNLDPNSSMKFENVYIKDGVIGCNGAPQGWINGLFKEDKDYKNVNYSMGEIPQRGVRLSDTYVHTLDDVNLKQGSFIDLENVCVHAGKVKCGSETTV